MGWSYCLEYISDCDALNVRKEADKEVGKLEGELDFLPIGLQKIEGLSFQLFASLLCAVILCSIIISFANDHNHGSYLFYAILDSMLPHQS